MSVQSVHGAFTTQDYNIEMNAVSAVQVEEASLEKLIGALGAREGEQWALRNMKVTICIDEIIKDIANVMAVGVSDGYFEDEGGTAA